ncbi:hypothetical protein GCM10010219_67410 [Streptomyces netropsis]|nr:hypothetical protein GCM10010219_67410 [Streptomyces netropsis]
MEPDGVRSAATGLTNRPSAKCGDRRMRAIRSPDGSAPKAAGRRESSGELCGREPVTAPPRRWGRPRAVRATGEGRSPHYLPERPEHTVIHPTRRAAELRVHLDVTARAHPR